jgi:hypothetical protein
LAVCALNGVTIAQPVSVAELAGFHACRRRGKLLKHGGGAMLILDSITKKHNPALVLPKRSAEFGSLFVAQFQQRTAVD